MAGKVDVTYRCDGAACGSWQRPPCVITVRDAVEPVDAPDACQWRSYAGNGCEWTEIRREPARARGR